MSLHEEMSASSDSFWDVDGYRRTVKRVEDGLHMCRELSKLIFDRAEIENEYARRLKVWSKKWTDAIEKGSEYGTNKAMLIGSLHEAESLSEVHLSVREKLIEVQADLKKWKNETYKKQMVGGCKEAKSFDDEFKKAQKPWSKKLDKVYKCRKDYHNACRLEKSLSTQVNGEVNPEQVKKLQDRLDKCRKEVESTKDKYEEALAVLHKSNNVYVDDMTEVFDKTQGFEEKRLRMFKELLVGIHGALDISRREEIPQIYNQLRQTIILSDANKDLKWWSQNNGVEMAMIWPTFEELGQEISGSMSRKDKTRSLFVPSNDPFTVQPTPSAGRNGEVPSNWHPQPTAAPTAPPSQEPPAYTEIAVSKEMALGREPGANKGGASQPPQAQRLASYDVSLNPFADDDVDVSAELESHSTGSNPTNALAEPVKNEVPLQIAVSRPERLATSLQKTSAVANANTNPFDDEDDNENYDNVEGTPVEALFDYEAQEPDEISFKRGEKFEKLKDRDDQGWCTGRKDGRVGLYPDNYVKVVI